MDILYEDYHKNFNSIEYQFFLLKNTIKEIFENFPNDNRDICLDIDYCDICSNTNTCNLYTQMQAIHSLNSEEVKNFLRKLLLKNPQAGKPNNLPDDKLIKRLFIKLLKNIDKLVFIKSNQLVQAQKNGEFYRLSLDSSGEIHELQHDLQKENDENDNLLIYETDVLITDQLVDQYFRYDGISCNIMGEKELSDLGDSISDSIEKKRIKFNQPKVMRLIDRKMAEEELKDD